MKNRTFLTLIYAIAITFSFSLSSTGQDQSSNKTADKIKSDESIEKKAMEWTSSLNLNDSVKQLQVTQIITTHLKAIRDWHNEHPYNTVPDGINPVTGERLSKLHRQIIANSAIPYTVHENLMNGLRMNLAEEQVEMILDKYTVGKVAFTMKGYKAIVSDIKPEEETKILGFLKQAREQAIDYKNMEQISAIFEIYKTKCEQYLNSNGRNWRELYSNYVKAAKAKKESEKKDKP